MRYLTAIAIGPVQDFIAAARRCRDLWCGSQLLSELSKAAAQALQRRDATLIFPAPKDAEELSKDGFTVVNKLLASVETGNIGAMIEEVRQAVRERLDRAADLRNMKLRGLVVKDKPYRDQLAGFLEFYAAWVPDLPGEYKKSRSRVEELLLRRENLRGSHHTRMKRGRANINRRLDGAREFVIQQRSNRLYESNLKANEYLDAIGVVKRFGGRSPRFDSTVDVAAVPFVHGAKKSSEGAARKRSRRYKRFLRESVASSSYLVAPLVLVSRGLALAADGSRTNAELKTIRKALESQILPYYALLLGDQR